MRAGSPSRPASGYRHLLAWLIPTILVLTGCVGPVHQRTLYDERGIKIGLATDLTTERTSPPTLNAHPRTILAEDLRTLLGSLEVSGYSGVILGIFQTPRPMPVFTTKELDLITVPIAQAFEQAGPKERVFFSIPGPHKAYPNLKETTSGGLFFRDQYLHVVLTDHYAFYPADPGGGEERDPRDTKGMKLWVAPPAQPAIVPDNLEPEWGPFEKVHLSLNVHDVLMARRSLPPVTRPAATVAAPAPVSSASPVLKPIQPATAPSTAPTSETEDLRLQLRELTNANLDLRNRLKEQTAELDQLRQELNQLRKELKSREPPKAPGER